MVTVAGGGFGTEALCLIDLLGDAFTYEYVVVRGLWGDVRPKLDASTRTWELTVPGIIGDGTLASAVKAVRSFVEAAWIVGRSRPDAVIGVGSSMAIALCFWGRVFGAKTIFIESTSRPYSLSRTGSTIRRFRLSHRLYSQWPGVARTEGVIYKGRLL